MKKLKLQASKMGSTELIARDRLKNIMGGAPPPGTRVCPSHLIQCNCSGAINCVENADQCNALCK